MAPAGNPRTNRFNLVLTDKERDMLQQLSEEDHRSAAEWIRFAIIAEFRRRYGAELA